jgi:hypothetical protein
MTEVAMIVERLRSAMNTHDLEALVDCFTEDVKSSQPAHPGRSFQGREQVRRNWTQIFRDVPDMHATLLGTFAAGESIAAEWCWTGRNGRFEMCGITVLKPVEDRISEVRLYMELVERASTIRDAVAVVAR